MSSSLTTNEDDAYKSRAWTGRRLVGGEHQHHSVDAQRSPASECPPPYQLQHRDSNEYASIWEPWPPTQQDSQDSSRRAGIIHTSHRSREAHVHSWNKANKRQRQSRHVLWGGGEKRTDVKVLTRNVLETI